MYQIVFQITFIRRILLIRIPLFQVSIAIFFHTKMKDFMQGASKSTGKSLEIKAFLLVILFFYQNLYQIIYIHQISESIQRIEKTTARVVLFLSIVHHSACELVHEVNMLQDFDFIHMIHIFKAS